MAAVDSADSPAPARAPPLRNFKAERRVELNMITPWFADNCPREPRRRGSSPAVWQGDDSPASAGCALTKIKPAPHETVRFANDCTRSARELFARAAF